MFDVWRTRIERRVLSWLLLKYYKTDSIKDESSVFAIDYYKAASNIGAVSEGRNRIDCFHPDMLAEYERMGLVKGDHVLKLFYTYVPTKEGTVLNDAV